MQTNPPGTEFSISFSRLVFLILGFVLILHLQPLAAEEKTPFARFQRLGQDQATFDTAVVRYRHPETGRVAALVGVVHMADPSYYEQIQEELDSHDVVLYEMVSGGDEADRERHSYLAELQLELVQLLGLSSQLDQLDYQRSNLRHADLTADQLAKELGARGESIIPNEELMRILAPLFRLSRRMTRSMSEPDPQMVNRLRWQMGALLGNLENVLQACGKNTDLSQPDDVIIGVRNDHAWSVFESARKERFQRIAILYGAAHMPDFERRLLDQGWVKESTDWFPAWHIPATPPPDTEPGRRPSPVRESDL